MVRKGCYNLTKGCNLCCTELSIAVATGSATAGLSSLKVLGLQVTGPLRFRVSLRVWIQAPHSRELGCAGLDLSLANH